MDSDRLLRKANDRVTRNGYENCRLVGNGYSGQFKTDCCGSCRRSGIHFFYRITPAYCSQR